MCAACFRLKFRETGSSGNAKIQRSTSASLPRPLMNPAPYTLHPKPYTLHPAPFTLPPTPYAHPTPYTLHPKPCALYPPPYTLHPTPYALHPTPGMAHSALYGAQLATCKSCPVQATGVGPLNSQPSAVPTWRQYRGTSLIRNTPS